MSNGKKWRGPQKSPAEREADAKKDAEFTNQRAQEFSRMLSMYQSQFAQALPKHLNTDRMLRLALTEFRRVKNLAKCDTATVCACVLQSVQLGLEIGVNQQASLVPYWSSKRNAYECQLIPGYRGLVDLMRRSKEIDAIGCHIVYEKDEYDFKLGTDEDLLHRPFVKGERGKQVFVYFMARFVTGGKQLDWMPWSEVLKIRDRSKSKDRDGNLTGPWVTDPDEMGRKTMARRASKYLPASPELQRAIALDEAAAHGVGQGLTVSTLFEDTPLLPEYDDDQMGVFDAEFTRKDAGEESQEERETVPAGNQASKDQQSQQQRPIEVRSEDGQQEGAPFDAGQEEPQGKRSSVQVAEDMVEGEPSPYEKAMRMVREAKTVDEVAKIESSVKPFLDQRQFKVFESAAKRRRDFLAGQN